MSKKIFYIVDVFAESRFAGNQLAVFRDGNQYSDKEMQLLAREMNFSETTFILSDEKIDGGFNVRIFTPAAEVPFAGHPTIGTAYVIYRELAGTDAEKINLNLQVGRIPVTLEFKNTELELLWMKQKSPRFGEVFVPDKIAAALKLDLKDLDERFPIQEVSTGLPFMIVPVKSLAAIKRAKVDQEKFFDIVSDSEAKCPLLFCPQPYSSENDLNVRVFVDYFDIPEDPATGSANGCLAGYLVKYKYFSTEKIDIKVEQGFEINRPSLLYLRAHAKDNDIEVNVGGKVFMVAQGAISD